MDFTSAALVTNLGHSPEGLLAVHHEVELLHTYTAPFEERERLARELPVFLECPHEAQVVFAVTGAEAMEIAIRAAFRRKGTPSGIVSLRNAFHGKTYGAGSVSDISRYKSSLPTADWVVRVGLAELSELDTAIEARGWHGPIAAVIIECVQGSTLDRIERQVLMDLRTWCSDRGCLLIVDEIQTGFLRCGFPALSTAAGIVPDILCVGKGLTCSAPMAALLLNGEAHDLLRHGLDTSTFAGNPISVGAALWCLGEYRSSAFQTQFSQSSRHFAERLSELSRALPGQMQLIVRGGMLAGVKLPAGNAQCAEAVVDLCEERGLLIAGPVGPDLTLIKLAPPLVIREDLVDRGISILHEVLTEVGTCAPSL